MSRSSSPERGPEADALAVGFNTFVFIGISPGGFSRGGSANSLSDHSSPYATVEQIVRQSACIETELHQHSRRVQSQDVPFPVMGLPPMPGGLRMPLPRPRGAP